MGRLGVSIYPEHSTPEKDKAYLSLAAKYGFKRVFTCLLSVNKPPEEIKADFKEIIGHANKLGMEVTLDVTPGVFKQLGISYDNLEFFSELGATVFRLDEGFTGFEEAKMTFNPQGLFVEVNASQPGKYVNNIFSYRPDPTKLVACHNFYPQKYTGLSYEWFVKTSKNLKELGVQVAAFVGSQEKGTYGPWPVNEGLCTLEIHRELPIDVQARHLFATGLVDDVIVANAYASEEELQSLSNINPHKLTFGIDFDPLVSEIEKDLILNFGHWVRGDMSDYMARSTFSRIDPKYMEASFPPGNVREMLHRGDVVVPNDGYGRYKGEVHLVLKDMPNDGRKNVVGVIPDNEIMLLSYIEPWIKFSFVEVKEKDNHLEIGFEV